MSNLPSQATTRSHDPQSAAARRADVRRLTERAGAVIGIVTGVLGVLLAVGFIFLPTATMAEKAYVCVACVAISVATATGIGAWRSLLRFSFTATCMCVAVVCMAALAVAVHDDQLPNAAKGSPAGGSTASQSLSTPVSSPTAGGAPASQLVTDMPLADSYTTYNHGPQTVNRSTIETVYNEHGTISCEDGSSDQIGSITYRLSGKFRHFHAEVVLADGAASGIDVAFTPMISDGNQDTAIASPVTLHAGAPARSVTANIPSGAWGITLEDKCSYSPNGTIHGNNVTAVWIKPTLTD